jgi:hypothetical protein
MAQIGEFLHWTTQAGKPITVQGVTVTPLAQSLTIRWSQGGFVWNRPVALLVTQNGRRERIPITDVTRLAQIVLWVSVGLLGLVLFSSSKRR